MELERIEQYNQKLQGMKQQASQLQASVDFYGKQLADTCRQLTSLLGYQVTPENLEQVYQEYMAKVENTVASGEEIMRRIEEKQSMDSAASQEVPAQLAGATNPTQMGVGQQMDIPGIPGIPGMPTQQYQAPGVTQGAHVWGAAATQGARVGEPVIGI